MKAITISNLRSKMKLFFDAVSSSQDVLFIPRNNNEEDAVVIISIKEYNALIETAYLHSTYTNHKRLEESIQQLRDGKTYTFLT